MKTNKATRRVGFERRQQQTPFSHNSNILSSTKDNRPDSFMMLSLCVCVVDGLAQSSVIMYLCVCVSDKIESLSVYIYIMGYAQSGNE